MTITQPEARFEVGQVEAESTTRCYSDFLIDHGLEDCHASVTLYTGALAANLATVEKDSIPATIIGPDVLAAQKALAEESPIPRHTA